MLQITREEAKYLRDKGIYVVKSCRLKNKGTRRSKFYCEESAKALRELNKYRSSIVISEEHFAK